MMYQAIEIAKSFLKDGVIGLDNNYAGNMKINSLLYFSQLISLALDKKPLLQDDIFIFQDEIVIENVRKEYKTNYYDLVVGAKESDFKFSDSTEKIIEITKDIFYNISSDELSKLIYQTDMWKFYQISKQSYIRHNHDAEKIKIDINKFFSEFKSDLDRVKSMLDSYFEIDKLEGKNYIEINSVKFYYNPKEIQISKELRCELEKFPADDDVYSIYKDDEQGLVIY